MPHNFAKPMQYRTHFEVRASANSSEEVEELNNNNVLMEVSSSERYGLTEGEYQSTVAAMKLIRQEIARRHGHNVSYNDCLIQYKL